MACYVLKSLNKSFSILQSAVLSAHLSPQHRCQSPESRKAFVAMLRRALRSLHKSWSAQSWAVRLRGDAVERRPQAGGTHRNRLLFEKFICFSLRGWTVGTVKVYRPLGRFFHQIPGLYRRKKRVLDAGEALSGAPWMRCALSRGRRITAQTFGFSICSQGRTQMSPPSRRGPGL